VETLAPSEDGAGSARGASLHADWLTLWQHVADISDGLEPDDPRLEPVLAAIERCDAAFMADDKAVFRFAVEGVV
jgi:hypothetical protein